MTKDAAYWAKRRDALLAQMERDEAKLEAKLAKLYASESAKLEHEIAAYYQKYGEGNVIQYRRLLAELPDGDKRLLIERMDEFGRKFPQWSHLLPVRASIWRLNELEGVQTAIRIQQLEIGAIEQDEFQAHFERQASRAANLAAEQMGFGSSFYSVDAPLVQSTVGAAWASGQSFSERIWGNREKLAGYLNEDFAKAVARGESYDTLARSLAERFGNVSTRDAKRLVYTEGTFLFNEAQAQVHESDFQSYALSCIHDGKACKDCLGIESEQKRHPARFSERQPGVNFPPLHPWCRCTYTVEVEDWDAWIDAYVAARGGDAVTPPIAESYDLRIRGPELSVKVPDYSRLSNKAMKRLTEEEIAGHMWLAQVGHDVVPLPNDKSKPANIDMLMDGEYWELKTPTGSGGRLRTRIAEGVSKWERLKSAGYEVGTPKIVVDNRFSSIPDDALVEMLRECMDYHASSNFDEVMVIRKSGVSRRYRRK